MNVSLPFKRSWFKKDQLKSRSRKNLCNFKKPEPPKRKEVRHSTCNKVLYYKNKSIKSRERLLENELFLEKRDRFAVLRPLEMLNTDRLLADETTGRRIPERVYTIFPSRVLLRGARAILWALVLGSRPLWLVNDRISRYFRDIGSCAYCQEEWSATCGVVSCMETGGWDPAAHAPPSSVQFCFPR